MAVARCSFSVSPSLRSCSIKQRRMDRQICTFPSRVNGVSRTVLNSTSNVQNWQQTRLRATNCKEVSTSTCSSIFVGSVLEVRVSSFCCGFQLLESLIERVDLSEDTAEASLEFLLTEANEALISAFLVLLRAKGETYEEVRPGHGLSVFVTFLLGFLQFRASSVYALLPLGLVLFLFGVHI